MGNSRRMRWLAAVILALAGCGTSHVSRDSTSLEETTVKGTVRVRGKPVDNGSVEFNAANVARTSAELVGP